MNAYIVSRYCEWTAVQKSPGLLINVNSTRERERDGKRWWVVLKNKVFQLPIIACGSVLWLCALQSWNLEYRVSPGNSYNLITNWLQLFICTFIALVLFRCRIKSF